MKIGINASFLRKPDTGIGQVTKGFIGEIINNSHGHEYFLYLEEDIDFKLPQKILKRVFLPKLWKRDDLLRKIYWEVFLLRRKVKSDRCDIFISLYQSPTIFPLTIKHKMLVHDMIWKVFPEYLNNWRKKLYATLCFQATKRADQIFTVSNWSKRDIHKYLKIDYDKIVVANPSVDKIYYDEADRTRDNRVLEKYDVYGRYIFYVGGFDPRKNITALLDAFGILREREGLGDVKLVLGGEDKSKQNNMLLDLKKEIENRNLSQYVQLIGFISQKNLPAFYRQCELFVLPSLYEGFGLMALEAMASGTPTAVSKSSSLPEVCGDAVLYFNPYDKDEMAKVMHKILTNNRLKHRLSEKGRERAKKFKWVTFTEKILG